MLKIQKKNKINSSFKKIFEDALPVNDSPIDQSTVDKITDEITQNFEKYGLNSFLGDSKSDVDFVNFHYTDPDTKQTMLYTINMQLLNTLHKYVQSMIIDKDPTLKYFKEQNYIPDKITPVFHGVNTAATDADGNFFINPVFFMEVLKYSQQWYNVNSGLSNHATLKDGLGSALMNNEKLEATLGKYVWGYTFILMHEACHRIYNHFYRAKHKQPPIPNYDTDEQEQLYVNLVQDMEINREIEKIFPELSNIVEACHGYRAPMDSDNTWEAMYDANIGRDLMNKKRPPGGDDHKGGGGPGGTGHGVDGKGKSPDPTPLNDAAQKGFEEGWNKCIEDVLILMGGSFKNTTQQEWKAIVDNINKQIELMNVDGVFPLPSLNVNSLTKFIVEQKTFKERFTLLFNKKNVLNEYTPYPTSQKIPSTWQEGYFAGYFECWQRILDEWNPSAAIMAGDEQMKKLGESFNLYVSKKYRLDEGALYNSDGINGWCLQNVDNLKPIPSNPKLKDHDLTDKFSSEEDQENPEDNNSTDVPKVPAPHHDFRRVNKKGGKQGGQGTGQNENNQDELAEKGKPKISKRVDEKGRTIVDVDINSEDLQNIKENSSLDKFGDSKDMLSKKEADELFNNLPNTPVRKQQGNDEQSRKGGDGELNKWADIIKNAPSQPGRSYSFNNSLDPIIENLMPNVDLNWREKLINLMTEADDEEDIDVEQRNQQIMAAHIPGASTIGRITGDSYIDEEEFDSAIASIFYLIDNSGSMWSTNNVVQHEAWAQIIELEKECHVKKSLATYYAVGLILDDEHIRTWYRGTDEEDILNMIRRTDNDISGGTDVIAALRQIEVVHNEESSNYDYENTRKLVDTYEPGITKLVIITDGEDGLGDIDWEKYGFSNDSIIWIFINSRDFLLSKKDCSLNSMCASVIKYFDDDFIVKIPTEELLKNKK